jgi:hypothetical protein
MLLCVRRHAYRAAEYCGADGPAIPAAAPRVICKSPGAITARTVTQCYSVVESTIQGHTAIMLLLLASFMVVVVPSADFSAAAGNCFLGRYQSGRDDDSPCGDKEKCEHSKWHVHK